MKRMLSLWIVLCVGGVVSVRAEMCAKCKDGMYTMDSKQCPLCKEGWTSSGAFKLCQACSAKHGQCEHCLAALGATSKVSPEQVKERLVAYRKEMEKEHPGSTKSPGADVEQKATASVTKWLAAMNNQDAAAALAVSATPFSWDRKLVADTAELEAKLKDWVENMARKKTPLKFSPPTFLAQSPVKGVGENLIWIIAFDQSGRTDDVITFYVKAGTEAKVVGFRD